MIFLLVCAVRCTCTVCAYTCNTLLTPKLFPSARFLYVKKLVSIDFAYFHYHSTAPHSIHILNSIQWIRTIWYWLMFLFVWNVTSIIIESYDVISHANDSNLNIYFTCKLSLQSMLTIIFYCIPRRTKAATKVKLLSHETKRKILNWKCFRHEKNILSIGNVHCRHELLLTICVVLRQVRVRCARKKIHH